ncbi:hypothetical protein FIV42_29355 [Persicimonas caeni]|uniref:Uncharacterized protein n=1 Tax=Persicimonas caeni TaxID=2292766 RepID=A0A4Y6Q2C2_PERCE|nr:hypothetical protein [Persicimonas caeni]QDG54703.1 hypothetical protein FIV42_29355 [Persicimonas caeni]QED35924.1 hypothetical protein FRD00_29350 [Persicimonas caeni]
MSDDKKKKRDEDDFEDSYEDAFDERFEDEHLFDEAEFEAEGWSIPRDPESVARVLKSLESLVPDILKRSSQEGEAPGAEGGGEGFRARLSDRKLPREAVSFILGQVDTTKREFLRILSREIRLFLENMDLGGELAKILTSLSFEVKMEVRFIPNDQAFRPSARGKMRVKRTRSKEEEDDLEDDEEMQEDTNEQSQRRRWSLRRRNQEDAGGEEDDVEA